MSSYEHHVICTINYSGSDFETEAQLSNWFKNALSRVDMFSDNNDEVFNFEYKVQIIKGRIHGQHPVNKVHVEFDTNKDENYIIYSILGNMECLGDNDGKKVIGEIIDDSLYISNTEEYS